MLAIVAAVLFLIALIFELAGLVIGPLGALVFITAGLRTISPTISAILPERR